MIPLYSSSCSYTNTVFSTNIFWFYFKNKGGFWQLLGVIFKSDSNTFLINCKIQAEQRYDMISFIQKLTRLLFALIKTKTWKLYRSETSRQCTIYVWMHELLYFTLKNECSCWHYLVSQMMNFFSIVNFINFILFIMFVVWFNILNLYTKKCH